MTKWHLRNPSRFIAKEKVRQKLKYSLELQYILFTGKTRNKPLQAYFLRHTLILQFLEHFTKAIIKGTFSCNNLVRRPIYIMNSVDTPKISFFHTLPPPSPQLQTPSLFNKMLKQYVLHFAMKKRQNVIYRKVVSRRKRNPSQ